MGIAFSGMIQRLILSYMILHWIISFVFLIISNVIE